MKSARIPMSVEEYHRLPWKRGWKYEYNGVETLISPRETVEWARFELRYTPFAAPFKVESPTEAQGDAIRDGLRAAFANSIEFCDYTEHAFAQARDKMTEKFLALARVERAWVIPLEARVIAGVCLVEDQERLALESLFVRPEWQRAGLARTLLLHVCNQLVGQGVPQLWSGYWVGNEPSRAWHHAMGFTPEPDFMTVGLEWSFQVHELERRRLMGVLSAEEERTMRTEINRLWQERERLTDEFVGRDRQKPSAS